MTLPALTWAVQMPTSLPLVLALHGRDVLAIAAVLLAWAALRRLRRRTSRRTHHPEPAAGRHRDPGPPHGPGDGTTPPDAG